MLVPERCCSEGCSSVVAATKQHPTARRAASQHATPLDSAAHTHHITRIPVLLTGPDPDADVPHTPRQPPRTDAAPNDRATDLMETQPSDDSAPVCLPTTLTALVHVHDRILPLSGGKRTLGLKW